MALPYDFVMCAFMLPLSVHGVVSGLRDMCAFRLLLTVHGVVLGLRDVNFQVTLDCA